MTRDKQDYGLELTRNSKTGWAFSLSRTHSCIDSTEICRRHCYVNGVRYSGKAQVDKRLRNWRTCAYLLDQGGPEALARNLVCLIDNARPIDWLAARFARSRTRLPFTLRLHDAGDYPEYRTIPTENILHRKCLTSSAKSELRL